MRNFACYRIPMDILPMPLEILAISNAMIGEPSLPNFSFPPKLRAHGVRRSSFDQLQRSFQRDLGSRGQKKMHMLGHNDKCMNLKFSGLR